MPNDLLPDSETSTKDDILDLLNEDDSDGVDDNESSDSDTGSGKKESSKGRTEETEEEEPETTEETSEESEELKLDEEVEKPDLDEVDLIAPPKRQEILKAYPDVFKKFPYLEKALYRDQKYSEMFPTFDDAKEAIDKAQVLDKFESQVMQGDTTPVLQAIKESDQDAFYKAVDNYLPALARVDQQAYIHVVGNLFKQTIMNMAQEANRLGENGEPLKNSALILHQFIFGGSQFEPPKNLAKAEPQDDRLKQREQEFTKRQFQTAYDDISTRIQNTLKSTINTNIDPKKEMSDYVRKQATRDAYEALESAISEDKRFLAIKDRLWENAYRQNFSREAMEAIRSAYLSKAKTVLVPVLKKTRNEALKGLGKVREEKDRKGHISVGKASSDRKPTRAGEVPKGMSTLDFLNQD